MMAALKRCPFCGGPAAMWREDSDQANLPMAFFYVECEHCHARTQAIPLAQYEICPEDEWSNRACCQAEQLWNKRHP